ncbi:50S ribosomal protein L6 [Candidatus Peregrinibacteria bacterium]|nr:50S ribosomal protein L6 [Candidatus Peregrinibacteria bacterium]
MSRIGKKSVTLPSGVEAKYENGTIAIKGTKGTLSMKPHPRMTIAVDAESIRVTAKGKDLLSRSLHGLTRTLIANMVTGVTTGFEKKMEIRGVGFRLQVQGKECVFALGFSHPVNFKLPEGIVIEIDKEKKNIFTIRGIDKQLVGQVAAKIRAFRPPEPYKGKGIRYWDEVVKQKAGKSVTTAKT